MLSACHSGVFYCKFEILFIPMRWESCCSEKGVPVYFDTGKELAGGN